MTAAGTARPRLRAPTLESLFVATLVLFGFRLGAHPIGDNSMFAHLRTGIDIAAGKGIPRVDPYSYTARGHEWVVQSWLAEWTYGWANRLWDLRLVILEQAVLTAVLAWLIVRLAKAGTPIRTAAAGSIALGAGAAFWTQRPLLFGLICMALTVTVVERGGSRWWLLPIVWVWVNTHGSFPLGLLWLGAVAVGEVLDRRELPRRTVGYAVAFVAGLAVACLNPLGPRLLTFAATVGEKQSVFRTVVEWRTPDFQHPDGLFTLMFLTLALLALGRARVAWRDILPAAGFVALGLIAMRNVPVAAIVLAPVVGRALRRPEPPPSAPAGARPEPPLLHLGFLAVIGLGVVVFAASAISGRALDLHTYPAAAVTYLDRAGLLAEPHRIAQQDVVGDYLVLRFGRQARVFIDDRFDMYPVRVSQDFATLLRGGPDALGILDRYRVDVVLWDRALPLVPLLQAHGGWHEVYRQKGWTVLTRSLR